MPARIPINRDALTDFCQQHHVKRLSLFGSVLRDDFDFQRSDIDVLVEFELGVEENLTYFQLSAMQHQLTELFSRPVELVLASTLDHYLRDEILKSAEVHFDAA